MVVHPCLARPRCCKPWALSVRHFGHHSFHTARDGSCCCTLGAAPCPGPCHRPARQLQAPPAPCLHPPVGPFAPSLAAPRPWPQFLVGGDGPKRRLLEAVVAEHGLGGRVSLVGAVPHERVRQLLVRGHVFLNCSLTEAFCMALVEAAAAGGASGGRGVGGVVVVVALLLPVAGRWWQWAERAAMP